MSNRKRDHQNCRSCRTRQDGKYSAVFKEIVTKWSRRYNFSCQWSFVSNMEGIHAKLLDVTELGSCITAGRTDGRTDGRGESTIIFCYGFVTSTFVNHAPYHLSKLLGKCAPCNTATTTERNIVILSEDGLHNRVFVLPCTLRYRKFHANFLPSYIEILKYVVDCSRHPDGRFHTNKTQRCGTKII